MKSDKYKKVVESINELHATPGIKTVITIVEYSNGQMTFGVSEHAPLATVYGMLKIMEAKIRLTAFSIFDPPKDPKRITEDK